MSGPRTASSEVMARHPELAHLALLDQGLALVEQVLCDAQAGDGRSQPSRDQARSMVGVMRLLRGQIESYRKLIELAEPASGRRRR